MDFEELEKRVDNAINAFENIKKFIDGLPNEIPKNIKEEILNKVISDKELNELMDGIKNKRPPRFVMVGRTGVGKSSLINAILGKYLAEVSNIKIGTTESTIYQYAIKGRPIFEILDTRGIGESVDTVNAEKELKQAFFNFEPDAALFLVATRDRINEDIKVFKSIQIDYLENRIPCIAIRTKIDELPPGRVKEPDLYNHMKLKNIDEAREFLFSNMNSEMIKLVDCLAVSSYIEWELAGEYIDPSKENLSDIDLNQLQIHFDGRYNIDELINVLEENIDIRASIYLNMVSRANKFLNKLSDRLTNIFALIASSITITPIPFKDIFVLTSLQIILVTLIGILAGRKMNLSTAKEFITSVGIVTGAGFAFQNIATGLLSLFPGVGNVINAGVAASGTKAIGKSASMYFINQVSDKETIRKSIKSRYAEELKKIEP